MIAASPLLHITELQTLMPMLDRIATKVGGKAHIAAGPPMKRLGEPREAADLIAYLASDAASYVTGQTVAIDGGRLTQ